MTCKCNDNIKIFTIRGTAFEAAKTSGGGAASENGKGIMCTVSMVSRNNVKCTKLIVSTELQLVTACMVVLSLTVILTQKNVK